MPSNTNSIVIANNQLIARDPQYWSVAAAAALLVILCWPYLTITQSILVFIVLSIAGWQGAFIFWRFHRDADRNQNAAYWEKWFIIANITGGVLWGTVGAFLLLQVPFEISTLVSLILTLMIGGWSIAQVPAIKFILGFSTPATATIIIAALISGNWHLYVVGMAATLFVFSVIRHSRKVASAFHATLEHTNQLKGQFETESQFSALIQHDYSRLRQFMNSLPIPITVSSQASGILLYVNQPALDLMGIDDLSERPNARGIDFFANPEEREVAVASLADTGTASVEFQLKRTDGSLLWVFFTARKITYEGDLAIIGSLTDITPRRQAEEELRKSEEKFRLLADHANDLINICSLEGKYIYVSPSIERLLGYRADEVINREISEFVHPDDLDQIFASNIKHIADNSAYVTYMYRIRHKSGHWEWMEASASIMRDERSGKPLQISAVSRLITERVLHEQELTQARERAEKADRAKSDFLAHMSHEIRTPLNAVIGFAEVMRDQMFGPLGSPRYLEYTTDIYNSGTHLLALINDVLDISKVEAGNFELQEDRVELDTIIQTTLRLIKDRSDAKRILLTSRLHDAPDLWCDRRVMVQVMLNLVGNAVKFTPDSGRITIESQLNSEGCLEITVTDTGVGIAAQDIPAVMLPFGQVRTRSDTAMAEPGTGLGLPLAKSFIEKHGGYFTLTSEPGIGTRATITLPASRVIHDIAKPEVASAAT